MKILLLIGSILISLIFLLAGIAKIYKSFGPEEEKTVWTPGKTVKYARTIALVEIISALLFLLPYHLGFLPIISHIASISLVILSIGAPISHIKMGENSEAALTTLLLIFIVVITFIRILGS
jgi:hypothetical protein